MKTQLPIIMYIWQGRLDSYRCANCGLASPISQAQFSFRSFVSFGQERSSKSAPHHAPIIHPLHQTHQKSHL